MRCIMDRKFHLKQFGFSTAAGIALLLAACGKTEETKTARPLRVGYQQGGKLHASDDCQRKSLF